MWLWLPEYPCSGDTVRGGIPMIPKERVNFLNDKPIRTDMTFVLYWMQASQRIKDNHALAHAIIEANRLAKPLVVCFGLTADFPFATRRHYRFMFEGLHSIKTHLLERRIRFILSPKGPVEGVAEIAGSAALVVTDRTYGRVERTWRSKVASSIPCKLVQVETNVIVPIETASTKEEYSAATLRRKIEPMIAHFAHGVPDMDVDYPSEDIDLGIEELSFDSVDQLLEAFPFSSGGPDCTWIPGGEEPALSVLQRFVEGCLEGYAELHNDPANPYVSKLSPYLHFGQISPISIYREVARRKVPDVPVFLEELVVRRELAMNFVYYNPLYDRYEGLPEWARRSLEAHEVDPRQYKYTTKELEHGETHDPYWNAAQKELVQLGTMHGYMRMYWGKKILEWSNSPKNAFVLALELNNRYQLDGRDPNGYAGVAWCFGKHDRPWVERPIFGNVRYMNDRGLERKFAIKSYVDRIEREIKR